MSIIWLVPAAIWGLAAIAVPILVHLLTRQERRTIDFPSLRFLKATRLAATRQRRLRDWLLLAVRAATIAAAVAALAGPLLVTAARERGWSMRTARAIVAVDDAQPSDDERRSAFASQMVSAQGRASNALRSAVEWLSTQPPAVRELLVVGDLREDTLDDGDVARVPEHIGIRFLPVVDIAPVLDVSVPVLTLAAGQPAVEQRRVHLNANDTVVEAGSNGSSASMPRIEMRAAPEDQGTADAALTALLDEGVIVDRADAPRVIVVWAGGSDPPATDGVRVVRVGERPTDVKAVGILRDIATSTFDDAGTPREVRRISAADLARWSRPPGPVPSDAVKQEEGDRRMLWALALALLALEWLLRRGDRSSIRPVEVTTEESRSHRNLDEGGPARRGGSHGEPRGYAAWSGRSATRRGGGGRVA